MSVLLSQGTFLESDVASATTCDIGATATLKVRITGTTTITSFGTVKNRIRIGRFAGILTLTNGATLVLPTAANITTAAGDRFWAESDNTATPIWKIISYEGTALRLAATNTTGGTTGAQTINKPSGKVNFAASATSLVVTNSLCTTASIVIATVLTNDTTSIIKNVVPGSGSFTITLNAAATAETAVGFLVIN